MAWTRTRELVIVLFITMLVTAFGCSTSDSPILDDPASDSNLVCTLPVGVSDWDDDGNPSAGMGTLGLFTLMLTRLK